MTPEPIDPPEDPFAGDLDDPVAALGGEPGAELPPLTPAERAELLSDLEDLEAFRALLEPRGVRGLVVDCGDCAQEHYFDWALLQSNLRHLLDHGEHRVHEPAFQPDPADYVTWDYARGYTDAVLGADED